MTAGGSVMMVRARAAKDGEILRVVVGFAERAQFGDDFHLAHRRGQVEVREAVLRRHGFKQVFNRRHADGGEHLLTFEVGMREYSSWANASRDSF